MNKARNYHRPILEKHYSRIFDSLDQLENRLSSRNQFRFFISKFINKLKSILFYELPIEFSIEEKNYSEKPETEHQEKKSKVA